MLHFCLSNFLLRRVSADGGERRLPVACGHPAVHEARRSAQLSAVLQAGRLPCGTPENKQPRSTKSATNQHFHTLYGF